MAATAWSLDFCFVCDRQTAGAAYCSQACRLSEMDRSSSPSEPCSPTMSSSSSSSRPWAAGHNSNAPDFSRHYKLFQSSLPFDVTPSSSNHSSKALTPSSSQTSLASLDSMVSSTSSSSSCSLPCQIRSELENYAGCFDHVRDRKRRLTSS